jgi:hypothetical protein
MLNLFSAILFALIIALMSCAILIVAIETTMQQLDASTYEEMKEISVMPDAYEYVKQKKTKAQRWALLATNAGLIWFVLSFAGVLMLCLINTHLR